MIAPTVTKTMPWPHQLEGLELIDAHPGSMIAYDMGTGKSKIIVDAVAMLRCKLVLIVCPKTVMDVWPAEFAKHGEGAHVVLLEGPVKARALVVERECLASRKRCVPTILVCNYDAVWRGVLGTALRRWTYDLIVCDESHRIKSPGGKASRFMSLIRSNAIKRACLTGTPLPHDPLDAYGQYRFLDPSIFGTSFVRFRSEYAMMGGFQGHQILGFKNMDRFNELFYSIGKRVTKAEVLPDLPEQIHETRSIELGPEARRAHDGLMKDLIALCDKGVITAANALVKFLRVQQITGGHAAIECDNGTHQTELVQIDRGKEKALTEILGDLDSGQPVVVFCKFVADLDSVHRAAMLNGRECYELSGREKQLKEWQSSDSGDVLAVQIQSGGVGIDLTRSSYCVYYSTGFSLGDYLQSLARLHRPGQKFAVTYVHLVCRKSIDTHVYKALRDKENVVEAVLKQVTKEKQEDVPW